MVYFAEGIGGGLLSYIMMLLSGNYAVSGGASGAVFGVIGGLLGVIIAMAIVIIIYLTNDTIKVEEDVERYLGLSVLGSIPYSEKESRSKKQKSRKRR